MPSVTSSGAMPTDTSRTAFTRFERLDALRGAALLWMAVFHGCFDLAHAGLLQANFHVDPLWTWQRTLILSSFLLCAGAGQALAVAQGQSWPRFWRRWAQIAGCALAVSAGSALMFPNSFIYFGVLHGMAVMLIVVRLTAHAGRWLWLAGALAVLAGRWTALRQPVFDSPWLDWTGLMTRLPITEDHVPLLPWLGVMWWGCAAMQEVLRHAPLAAALARPLPAGLSWLCLPGRWSLTFYMVHQPVLLATLSGVLWLSRHA